MEGPCLSKIKLSQSSTALHLTAAANHISVISDSSGRNQAVYETTLFTYGLNFNSEEGTVHWCLFKFLYLNSC